MDRDFFRTAFQVVPENMQNLIDECVAAKTLSDVYRTIDRFTHTLGLDNFFLFMTFSLSVLRRKTVVLHNYPSKWFARYQERNYYRLDPVFDHCRKYVTPLIWGQLNQLRDLANEQSEFLIEARSFGISDGVTYPLHGGSNEWGLLTFNFPPSREMPGKIKESIVWAGKLFSSHLQDATRRIVVDRSTISIDPALTEREKECLLWSTEGKTSWETAQILAIAERTVVYHLQNAMEKLGATNRIQAAVRALAHLSTDPEIVHGAINQKPTSQNFVAMSHQE